MNKFTKLLCIAAAVAAMSAMASCGGSQENSPSDSSNASNTTSTESASVGEKSDLKVEIADLDEDTVTVEFDGEAKAVSYEASGNTILKVEYEGADGTAYAKSETAPANAGKYTVTLSFAGNETYNAYSKTVTLVVEKAQNVLRVEVADVLEGDEVKPTVVENNAGEVTYRYKGRGDTAYEESDVAPTEIGTYTLIATAAPGQNYYGSRIEVEFSVYSDDPLYGLEASVIDEVKNKDRISDMHLAKKSYMTNGGQGVDGNPVGYARESLNGIVTSKDTHIMLLSDQLDADTYSVVIKSNKSFLAYFHFAIEGGDSYETVRNQEADYVAKSARDIQILAGTQVISFSLKNAAQAGKPIKGVYIDLYNAVEGSELTVYGFYKAKEVTDAEVPEELKNQLADKFALDYEAPTDGGWETNKKLQKFGDKIIVCEKENLALLSDNMPETIYLLVKADKASIAYFRFGVDEQYTYETVVNQQARYCKFKNDVSVAEGYQILEITMVPNPEYTGGANKPVTGVHILLDKSTTFTLFGIWADKAVEKEKLEVTVAGENEGTVNATYTGEAIPVAYTVTADTVLKVEYEGVDGTTYERSETAPTNAGKYAVKLSFAGDKVYEAFEKTVTLVIAKAENNLAVTVENIREGETIVPQVRSNYAGEVTYRYKGREDTTYAESETAPTAVGKYTLIASTAETENYLSASVEVDFEISQGKVDLTVVFENESQGTVNVTYDGEANPVVYTAQGITLKVEYEGADGTVYERSETAPTNAGNYTVKLTYAGDDRFNAYEKTLKFVIGKAENTLEVTVETILEGGELAPVVVRNNAGEVTYRYKGRDNTSYEESDVAPTAAGTYTLIATAATNENYLASEIEVNFEILSEDPLFGLDEDIRNQVKDKVLLDDMRLAGQSWMTNIDVSQSLNGIVTSKNTHIMLLSDQLDVDTYSLVIKSNKSFLAYFHFAIEGGDSYETVRNQEADYVAKTARDIQILAGTQVITFSLKNGAQAGKPLKGVYIDLYNAVEGSELTVYGFYKTKEVTDAEVPEELKNQLAGKFALTYEAPTDGGWETNKRLQKFGDKIIVCEKENLALLSENMPEKIYLLVKADKASLAYFRFGVDGQYTYETVVNQQATYCKFKNDVNIAEGYQILEITMTANPEYTGSASKPITGVHILLDKTTTITLFGIWADEEPKAPEQPSDEELLAELQKQVADKKKLEITLSAPSWDTNGNQTKQNEDGSITVDNSCLSLDIKGIKSKIYLLVKSDAATVGYFRFAVGGNHGYDPVATDPNNHCKYYNDVNFAKGFSLIEIDLAAYSGYLGDADAEVTGVHVIWSTKTTLTIYGMYVDVSDEEILAGFRPQLEGKAKLEIKLSAPSWDTNGNQTKQNEDGSVTVDNSCLSLDIKGAKSKIYLLVKSDALTTGYFRFAVGGDHSYATVVNDPDHYCKYFNEVNIPEGFSLIEIDLSAYSGYVGESDAEVTGVHVIWTLKTTLTIYGIYVDA